MTELRISPELALPLDAVTQAISILAKRGAGKTFTSGVLVEEMLEARVQVVVLDPMGHWWGLRSSADGKSKGYPIAVLGGDHADVPLEPTGGEIVADLVVDERLSMVLDVSRFSKGERRRFVTDLLERVYARNRESVHLVIEEADMFAPQRYGQGDERMLGAMFDIVRRGRGRGVGSTLITQRSASLNNEVLEQTDILLAMRTTGPADRKAISRWIDVHEVVEQKAEVLASLPKLPTGTAWVWWPEEELLQRVAIRAKRTFDSSATPKPGEVRRTPKTLADVDLGALEKRMAETIERARADDPRELRKEIAALKRQLAARATEAAVLPEPKRVEVPVLNGQVDKLEELLGQMREIGSGMILVGTGLSQTAESITTAIARVGAGTSSAPMKGAGAGAPRGVSGLSRKAAVPEGLSVPSQPTATRQLGRTQPAPARDGDPGEVKLKAGARRMLEALAGLHPTPLTRVQVGTLADISPTSGTFSDYLSAIRQADLIVEGLGASGQSVLGLSDAGVELMAAALGQGAPSSEQLLEMWGRKLKAGARRMLQVLHDAYPGGLSRQELGEQSGISPTSGTFSDYLSMLRRTGLLDESQGDVRAGEALFLGSR